METTITVIFAIYVAGTLWLQYQDNQTRKNFETKLDEAKEEMLAKLEKRNKTKEDEEEPKPLY